MSKWLHQILIGVMFKMNWLRLLLAGALMTATGIAFQLCVLPYPLNELFLSPQVIASLNKSSNSSLMLKDPLQAKFEENQSILAAPLALLNCNESIVSVSLEEKKFEVYNRESRQIRADDKQGSSISDSVRHKNVSLPMQRPISSMKPLESLLYAKKDIQNAPVVSHDPDLHAPLFRNVSIFKRSYELMEMILKIYVYRDGARPIFHQPHLRGIYASEGWFMKLIEANTHFVTKDPESAHLFYLPYSARQLEHAIYVPNSHDLKPLSMFLRDYVNMIARKYPFWNRTHGSDHFLVACHDWGPYTLKEHKELRANTIKALCNADLSEGVFVAGKDVSLPETTIRSPRRPIRNVGGKRVSQRPILAFFAGHLHGRVRPVLLEYWKGRDEDMKIFGPLPNSISRKMSYIEHMKSSKFCICPMGFEVNSPRIVEAIYYECVPVIIADNFAPPFYEVLDWSSFSVIVGEKDIPHLKDILLSIPLRRYLAMQTNVKMLQKHFVWNPRPIRYDLFHMILHSLWLSRLNHIQLNGPHLGHGAIY